MHSLPLVRRRRATTRAVPLALALFVLPLASVAALHAQEPAASPAPAATPTPDLPVTSGQIEVTTTRVPEAVEPEPAEITVITANELAARGVRDMAGALSLLAGVVVGPGGESGPAGFVPELWGLREVDAFLLVVDGVPWGGAFNPDVAALDLVNVERIEVLRGAAPVMYGATAFSGVIHIIHHEAGAGESSASIWGGRFSSFGASAQLPLPGNGNFRQSISIDGEKDGFADDRAGVDRGHLLYRATAAAAGGTFRFDGDLLLQNQDPNSPHPRGSAQTILDPRVPLDANHNPSDARLDEDRYHLVTGYDHALLGGAWSSTLSYTHSSRDITRGFVRRDEISDAEDVTADGFRQGVTLENVYFDTHFAWQLNPAFNLIVGIDELYGNGDQESENFEYEVALDGEGAPNSHSLHVDESTDLHDKRNFTGIYGQLEWHPSPRWTVETGLRFNHTKETREGGVEAHDEAASVVKQDEGEEEDVEDEKSLDKWSGVFGVNYLAWDNASAGLWVFGDYRRSFKPAALDFGPEVEGSAILEPETSDSFEVGLKGTVDRTRIHWQLTAFDMKLDNLLVNVDRNGLPGLANGGKQRFKGVELEGGWQLMPDLEWDAAVAWHDPKFEDYTQIFDDVPTQLKGNRPELAPKELYSTGLTWFPAQGFNAHARVEYVGDRWLNRRNTVLAPSYTRWDAGIGYRFDRWELRLDGDNLSDERAPVSESELGEAQFYRLPARMIRLEAGVRF